jgi:hypothetical protein
VQLSCPSCARTGRLCPFSADLRASAARSRCRRGAPCRGGDTAAVGFSPRKASLALYGLIYGPDAEQLLPRLGKHKTGVGCLYINKLDDDVDTGVLEQLVREGYGYVMSELHRP